MKSPAPHRETQVVDVWSCEGMFDEAPLHHDIASLNPIPCIFVTPSTEEIIKIAEQMPRFPGCEELSEETERKACSDKKLLEFVYSNIKLPPKLKSSCQFYPGVSVVQFVVEKDGTMSDIKVVRSPGHGLGESVLAAVQEIQKQNIRWIPGQQNGHPVRVQFNLPVRFHLE